MCWDLRRSGEAKAQDLGRYLPGSGHHPPPAGLHHVWCLLRRHGGEPQGQPDAAEDGKAVTALSVQPSEWSGRSQGGKLMYPNESPP